MPVQPSLRAREKHWWVDKGHLPLVGMGGGDYFHLLLEVGGGGGGGRGHYLESYYGSRSHDVSASDKLIFVIVSVRWCALFRHPFSCTSNIEQVPRD